MVLIEDNGVAEKDRGATSTQLVFEGPQRYVPLKLAVAVVADQAARSEKTNHELPVRHGRGHGRRTEGMQLFQFFIWSDAFPQHRARRAIDSERQQGLVAKAG